MDFNQFLFPRFFDENAHCNTLLDVKQIFILRTVRTTLFLLTATVQVEDLDIREGLHEGLTHTPMCNAINISVVSYEGKDAIL